MMAIFDYAPAPESVRPQIREDYGLFIDGRWTTPESDAYFETVNPANETTLARVAYANEADVDRAVRAARKAYDKYWRKLKPADRAKYIYRIARTITERSRELAVLETMDGGKPIKESRDFDIPTSASHFFYYAGWA
ncbi:MAG TPA: aldehyde dehydrogenase family protein, partial [Candidatus Aquilonibacter sp.]